MLAMGDPETPHRSQAIKPYYEHSQQFNPVNGEAIPILTGRYGDTVPLRVSGIIWKGLNLSTRKHVWMLFKVDSEDVTLRSEAQAERTQCHDAADSLGLGLVSITVPTPFHPQEIIHEYPTQH